MHMFGINKPHFLGIDFGTSYIKAVELTLKNGLPVLANYGHIEMSFTEGRDALFPTQSPENMIREHLKALLEALHPVSKTMNLALPGFSGLITLIELPLMKPEELEQAIPFEAHKYIPSPLEEVAFSWEVLSNSKGNGGIQEKKVMEVLLVAALRKEVAKYERYVADTGLSVDLLELEIFPLVRSIAGDKTGMVLVVDIGSRATNLVLTHNGEIRLNRSLNAGGNEITSTLAESFHVSWERAEELKRGKKDFLNNRESSLAFSSLDLVTSEISRILQMHATKHATDPVREMVLSGGTARMQGLSDYLSNLFHIPVSIADPWRGVQCDDALRSSLDRLGPSFSIAIGLALGGVERYRKK